LAEYLAFHYLEPTDFLPKGVPAPKGLINFPKACARLLLSQSKNRTSRALDLGCAVGRSSFELAHKIPEVIGIDYSRSFIRAAKQLQKKGKIRFSLLEEGKTTKLSSARVSSQIDRDRLRFIAGDALRIPKKLGTFDLVLAANLIDRLPEPARFLKKVLPQLVRPGGILLLTSPYTWSSDFTPETRWLHDSFPTIQRSLRPHFRLLHRQNLPFLLREHRRKFQYTFADATLWRRLSP
jgi:putative 4-mercaptohistidine N1-methyltranferase